MDPLDIKKIPDERVRSMAIISVCDNDGDEIATCNVDGTWWVDWGKITRAAESSFLPPINSAGTTMIARLLIGARASLKEVTREEATAISDKYLEKLRKEALYGSEIH